MPNFAPNVTYNVPVVQPVQWKEVEKPDINIRPIDIGGVVSSISARYIKEEEDKAKKEYQAGLNKYALELDRIVEGQRQGRYNQYQADRLMREATDNMIGLGWNAMDVAPVRDKFSGKVPELEQRRQTMMMEHQQEFEEKQIETFRTENPFYANESDATVKNIVGTLDNLERNVKYYNELALQGKTDEEIASYANQRIKSGEDLVAYNVFMDLKTMLNTPEALANMNQQQYDVMVHNLKLALRDKYKYDQGMADVIVDRAMNSMGADQVIKDVKDTYRNNTEWNKMAVENVDSSAQYAVRKISAYPLYNALNPEARQAIAMQKPTFINDLYSEMEKTIENPDYAKASIKTLGANTVQDAGWTTQIYTSLVGDRLKPTSYLAGLAVTGTKQAVNVLKNPFETTNEADRRTNLDNARKILNAYKDKDIDDMRRQAAMRGDTSTIAALDVAEQNLGYAKAVVTAYDQMQATPELRNLAASLQNQGTSRFRIDPETGKLLMTRKTTGAMQTLGDLIASAETRQQVNKVNDLLESSSPAERKAYVTMMFNNDIANYNGEELWDTSKRSLKEMFADAANNLASAATGLATFRSDPEAMKAIEDNDERAFGLLNERKIGVLGDRFLQRLIENPEQSERNAAIDAELKELQQPAFTGGEIMKNVMLDEAAQNSASGLDSFLDTGLAYIKDQFFPEAEDMPIDSAQLKKELDAKMPKMVEEYKKSTDKGNKSIEKTSAELMDIVKKRMDSLGYTPESLQLRKELSENYDKFQEAMQEFIQIEVLKAKLEDTYKEERELYETGFKKIDEKYDAARLADEMNRIETSVFTGEETTQTNKVSNKTTLSNAFVETQPKSENYNNLIMQASEKYGINPAYLDLIAYNETRRGNYNKTSSAGAKGLMQFMPDTWKNEVMKHFTDFTEDDIYDDAKSVEAAAWYLKKCERFASKFSDNPQEIAEIQAACYNWGMGKVEKTMKAANGNWDRAFENMPTETKKYVQNIKDNFFAEDPYDDRVATADELNQQMDEENFLEEFDEALRSERVLTGEASFEEFLEEWLKRYRNRKSIARARIHARAEANRK